MSVAAPCSNAEGSPVEVRAAPITTEGDPAAPNTFWSGWDRLSPTSANVGGIHSSCGEGMSGKVGVMRVSAENARRHNAASAVFDQIQTFVVRDSQ